MRWLAIGVGALTIAVLAGAATVGSASDAARAQPRPNVIVIETDDQAVETLRVMPNVRSLLVAQGTTFTNSFASYPLCCPSRATLLTGQYAHNHGVLGNTPPNGGYERLDHSNTLAVWLQRAGYHTALIGKYLNGYGRRSQTEVPPGWSEWNGAVRNSFFGHRLNENGTVVTYGNAAGDYQTDVLARKAVDLVRRRAPAQQPFFLWLTPFAPHSGGPADPDDPPGLATTKPAPRHHNRFASAQLPPSASFNEADVSDKPAAVRARPPLTAERAAAIREAYQQQLESLLAIDEMVAAVVAELRARRELGNTLIVLTADNGFMHGQHRIPSGKNVVYEASIRVPLIVRGPGVPRGARRSQLVANIDVAPTVVDAANARAARRMDGRSLLPLLRNARIRWRTEVLLERGAAGGGRRAQAQAFSAIRTSRYVHAEYGSGERELYDLRNDPGELQSRHADPAYARVAADLARRLARLRACAGPSCRG
jgi:N-acetylglucosamine-6-sulfatase